MALGALVGLVFLVMGLMKFPETGPWTALFERWGYPAWFRHAVGLAEVLGGSALVVPRAASYAAAVLAAVMAGAFVTRLRDGFSGDHVAIVVYAALLCWIAYEWRDQRWGRHGRS